MDILLVDKAAEMVGIKSKFADTGSGGSTKAVWAIISVICLVFAMWHAYNANKCEKQGSKLIMSLVLSFLFPKLSAVYYAMKYKAMPWGADGNPRLIEKYHAARAGEWDMSKCSKWMGQSSVGLLTGSPIQEITGQSRVEILDGGRGNMFGGWA